MKLHKLMDFVRRTVAGISGSHVVWFKQTSYEDMPTSPTSGIGLVGASKTLVMVKPENVSTCSARVWLYAGGVGDYPSEWVPANEGTFHDIPAEGLVERLTTSGFDRIYVQILDPGVEALVHIGPGVVE